MKKTQPEIKPQPINSKPRTPQRQVSARVAKESEMRVERAEQEDELSDDLIESRREAAALRSQNAALSHMLDARGVWAASLQESRNAIEAELQEARRERDVARQLLSRLEERWDRPVHKSQETASSGI